MVARAKGWLVGLPGAGDKPPRYIGSGMTVANFSIDVRSREIRAWIPACAGITTVGIGGFRIHVARQVRSFSHQRRMEGPGTSSG